MEVWTRKPLFYSHIFGRKKSRNPRLRFPKDFWSKRHKQWSAITKTSFFSRFVASNLRRVVWYSQAHAPFFVGIWRLAGRGKRRRLTNSPSGSRSGRATASGRWRPLRRSNAIIPAGRTCLCFGPSVHGSASCRHRCSTGSHRQYHRIHH